MSKKRILIVEDEALTVLALQQELEELGYEIAGNASTAADALRTAEDNRADLVLMIVPTINATRRPHNAQRSKQRRVMLSEAKHL